MPKIKRNTAGGRTWQRACNRLRCYFLATGPCVMRFILKFQDSGEEQRKQCRCLETDQSAKLEKGLYIVNKAQEGILGWKKKSKFG